MQNINISPDRWFIWIIIGVLLTAGDPDLIDAIRDLIVSVSKYLDRLVI